MIFGTKSNIRVFIDVRLVPEQVPRLKVSENKPTRSIKDVFAEMNREKGFSLQEMTIIVAIAGILASIAVPNFTRYQKNSLQNEAKINLEALYAAEKSFRFNYNYYSARLDGIGFKPAGSLIYRIGFAHDSAAYNGGQYANGSNGCVDTSVATCYGAAPWTESTNATGAGPIPAANLSNALLPTNGDTFTAEARGMITGSKDVWQVKHNNSTPVNCTATCN